MIKNLPVGLDTYLVGAEKAGPFGNASERPGFFMALYRGRCITTGTSLPLRGHREKGV